MPAADPWSCRSQPDSRELWPSVARGLTEPRPPTLLFSLAAVLGLDLDLHIGVWRRAAITRIYTAFFTQQPYTPRTLRTCRRYATYTRPRRSAAGFLSLGPGRLPRRQTTADHAASRHDRLRPLGPPAIDSSRRLALPAILVHVGLLVVHLGYMD